MTDAEHVLLLTIIAKQQQHTKMLLDILKSRGLLTGDDAQAFEFSANVDAASNVALFRGVKEAYVQLVKGLKIPISVELETLEWPPAA